MIKNVTPFFLDGGVQNEPAADTNVTWNGVSSFVTIAASGARTFTLPNDIGGKKIPFGTMVVVVKSDDNSNAITVNPASDLSADVPSVNLSSQYQTCMFMFKGPSGSTNTIGEWALLSFGVGGSGGTFNGGTVANVTTFNDTTTFNGASVFNASAGFYSGLLTTSVGNSGLYTASIQNVTVGSEYTQNSTIVTVTGEFVVCSGVTVALQAITLTALPIGVTFTVFNTGSATMRVYPPTGGQINSLGVNAAYSVAASRGLRMVSLGSGNFLLAIA